MTAKKTAQRSIPVLLPVALFGLVVTRLLGLWQFGLWHDEGFSVLMAEMPLMSLLSYVRQEYLSPPLYPLFEKTLFFIPNFPLWGVRLPSFLASLGSAILLWRHAPQKDNSRSVALFLFAFSPIAVFYATEGRNYAVFGFFYLLAVVEILRFLSTRSIAALWIGAAATLVVLYLHGIGLFFASGLLLAFLLGKPDRSQLRQGAWAIAGVALFYTPWFLTLLNQAGRAADNASLAQAFAGHNALTAPLASLTNFIPGALGRGTKAPIPNLSSGGQTIAWVFLLAFATSLFLRNSASNQSWVRDSRLRVLAGAILAPLFFLGLYSQVRAPAFQIGRSEAPLIGVFCLWMALWLSHLPSRILRNSILLLWFVSAAFSLGTYYGDPAYPRKRWDREAARALCQSEGAPTVILHSQARASVAAYAERLCRNKAVLLFPSKRSMTLDPESLLRAQQETVRNDAEYVERREDLLTMVGRTANGHFRLLTAAPSEDGRQFHLDPAIRDLVGRLQREGYVVSQQQVFPMDWQAGGYHLLIQFMKKTGT